MRLLFVFALSLFTLILMLLPCSPDETLFKEFALVNLKHYKSGAVRHALLPVNPSSRLIRLHRQIALRWRTEDEVLSGIGHLTCASLRCEYHEPSPAILAALEEDADVPPDPDSTTPLVEARLEEMQMPFGYVERGEKKTTLVKVVLCRECGKKLRYGRQKAKEERGKKILETSGGAERARDERVSEHVGSRAEQDEQERRRRGRHADEEGERDRRRSRGDERGSSRRRTSSSAASEDYGPALPPELASSRSHTSPPARSPRRSASPPRRR